MTTATMTDRDAEIAARIKQLTGFSEYTLKDHRRKWTNALISGELKQVRGLLTKVYAKDKSVIGHCCLGLACDLAGEKFAERREDPGVGQAYWLRQYWEAGNSFNKETAYLTSGAMKWLGVSDSDPEVGFPGDHEMNGVSCATLNDNYKWNFKQIGEAIKQYGFAPNHDVIKTVKLRIR